VKNRFQSLLFKFNLYRYAQVVQAAGIYAAKFAKAPPGRIIRGCSEPGAIAVEHAAVAEALKRVRDTTVGRLTS
jgi:hypothetical protein